MNEEVKVEKKRNSPPRGADGAKKSRRYPDKAAMKAGIVELLGDDEDGIAATMEDFGL